MDQYFDPSTNTGMGSQWPSGKEDSTLDQAVEQAKWYAIRLNYRQGNGIKNPENDNWQPGTRNNDWNVGIVLLLCGGTCEVSFSDGSRIWIQSPRDGVLSYRLDPSHPPTQEAYPTVVGIVGTNGLDYTSVITQLLAGQAFGEFLAGIGAYLGNLGRSNSGVSGDPYGLGTDSGGSGGMAPGNCSFTPETLVNTPRGYQPIGRLVSGEQVVAYNPLLQSVELQPIVHVWMHSDSDLVDVVIVPLLPDSPLSTQVGSEEIIHTTSEHPFLTTEGFVPAGRLLPHMQVLREDGQVGMVEVIRKVPGTLVMLNLEIANIHTFAVGRGQWIVHNVCVP